MSYSKITPPIHINATSMDRSNPLMVNYYGASIAINGISEIYDWVCINFQNLTIELYDGRNDVKPIATVPLVC